MHAIDQAIENQAEEQVVYLKNHLHMRPDDIIRLYGGHPCDGEDYRDAVERIAVFNYHLAEKNGFIA